jgi:cytochrome c553
MHIIPTVRDRHFRLAEFNSKKRCIRYPRVARAVGRRQRARPDATPARMRQSRRHVRAAPEAESFEMFMSIAPAGIPAGARCDYPRRRKSAIPRRRHLHRYEETSVRTAKLVVLSCLVTGSGFAAAQGQDPNLARNIAASCTSCHGTNGVTQGGAPSLAGQSKADLVRKMQDFKAGKTPATIMHQLAKGYTDEQIDLASSFFAAQKP